MPEELDERTGEVPAGTSPVAPPRPDCLLEICGVTKRFGPLVACDDVSIAVRPGEIRGLLGQNGAGKSTLMKIVVGVERPTAGEVRVAGTPLRAGDPEVAAAAGVAMVHQHFSLVDTLTVWQNVVLGDHRRLDRAAAVSRIRAISERYGLDIDPFAVVGDLSAGLRQRVEIIKCLRRDPKVIILDEPTSVLTHAESRRLFEVLRTLVRDHGHAAVLISHRLEEILHATDDVTILRDGRAVATVATPETDAAALARMMLGRQVELEREAAVLGLGEEAEGDAPPAGGPAAAIAGADGVPLLEVRDAVLVGDDRRHLLDGCSLRVLPGEIVGVAGVEGNGQAALVDLLSGLHELADGQVVVRTAATAGGSPATLDQLGVIPADRHDSGCILDMTVAENLVLNHLGHLVRRGAISRRRLDAHARELVAEFDVSVPDVHAPMWTLSGGNQQKLVLARELSRRPPVLVAAQPTRGLDVGAIEYMWDRLRDAARSGMGILLVSTELDEILALSQRVAVIHRGRIVGEMPRSEVDAERLGLMMGGQAA